MLVQTCQCRRNKRMTEAGARLLLVLSSAILIGFNFWFLWSVSKRPVPLSRVPVDAAETLAKCLAAQTNPGPPASFFKRSISDRFQPGTKPVLVRNATIWTGQIDGLEVVQGDILLDKGIIKAVGQVARSLLGSPDISILDVKVHSAHSNHDFPTDSSLLTLGGMGFAWVMHPSIRLEFA